MKILVTGALGFIGKNLVAQLGQRADAQIIAIGRQDGRAALAAALAEADFIVHLAGVNRPQSLAEFQTGNTQFTAHICEQLLALGRATPLVFSSSIQATVNNPYGASKRQAEAAIRHYAARSGAAVAIYRLPGVFGKWCRPDYNSVVATFCYNIAHDLPITIHDPRRLLDLVYIDDVMRQFTYAVDAMGTVQPSRPSASLPTKRAASAHRRVSPIKGDAATMPRVKPVYQISLGALAEQIRTFRHSRQTLFAPGFDDPLVHKLYATYLSYLDPERFAYQLEKRSDPRGSLAEFIKLPAFGQIFVSRTQPGVTRGNHYHHTKTEKFLVLEGEAIVSLRGLDSNEIIEYPVDGRDYAVVDIPPGYTHSIENVGSSELVTLFWASEVFDPQHPDTYYVPVVESPLSPSAQGTRPLVAQVTR